MPTLSIEREALFNHLSRTYTDEEFEDLCFEFGVELDEITSERIEAEKNAAITKITKIALDKLSTSIIYKIDVPANRYDLLCIEGFGRALKIFLNECDVPEFTAIIGDTFETMTVYPSTKSIRPHIVCAILRDITFTPESYKSFMDLQDQLHRNLCRHRTLVAIGTHDLDTINGPFEYHAKEDINFVPLTHDNESFDVKDLLDLYLNDPNYKHLKPYVPIIYESNGNGYPVIQDSDGTVLSLPPIINGSKSKITLQTKNVFIECTATDSTKANVVLDTMVTMFSEYCSQQYTVEPVYVSYVDEKGEEIDKFITPQLHTRTVRVSVDYINSMIGDVNLSPEEIVDLCYKVQLAPAYVYKPETNNESIIDDFVNKDKKCIKIADSEPKYVVVTVPPTRSDILHPVDVAEDIGIAYGYNNIPKRTPIASCVGSEQPINALTDKLRDEIARAGYMEVLTHGLVSYHDNYTALRRPIDNITSASLSNPANIEYQIVRTTLLPGLLKTLQYNKGTSFLKGFKVFEISDVVITDNEHTTCNTIVGTKNVRKICAIYAGPTSGFEIIHGLVDRILSLCEVSPSIACIKNSKKKGDSNDQEKFRVVRENYEYSIIEDKDDPLFFTGRAASILLSNGKNMKDVCIGKFGILHPEVLKNFDIAYPASILEMDLECLL